MGDFHGDDSDPIFPGQFEYIGQTFQSMPLEGIGVGAGFVGSHSGALQPELLQSLHHDLHVFSAVHRAKSGKQMKILLVESDPVVFEIQGGAFRRMFSKNPKFVGNADDLFYCWQR